MRNLSETCKICTRGVYVLVEELYLNTGIDSTVESTLKALWQLAWTLQTNCYCLPGIIKTINGMVSQKWDINRSITSIL